MKKQLKGNNTVEVPIKISLKSKLNTATSGFKLKTESLTNIDNLQDEDKLLKKELQTEIKDENVNLILLKQDLLENPMAVLFKDDVMQKKLFEEICNLRKVVKEQEAYVIKLKEEELYLFKNRYETFKLGNAKQTIQYDLIYAALFGNHTII